MTVTQEEVVVSRGEGAVAEEAIPEGLKTIVSNYKAKLQSASKLYEKQLAEVTARRQAATEAAEPDTSFFGITYPWWNLLMLGPFQAAAPGGPFQPSKIMIHGERAFMIAALWRNPVPLPGGPNPSAAQIMSPFNYRLRGEMINLSAVSDGPDFSVVNSTFGGGFINIHVMDVPNVPPPADGRPTLYEANFTVDILGVGTGLPPFAGYSTWLLDPDNEPPFLLVPGQGPRLQHDIPARFLVYV